jgi:hypothetical protein
LILNQNLYFEMASSIKKQQTALETVPSQFYGADKNPVTRIAEYEPYTNLSGISCRSRTALFPSGFGAESLVVLAAGCHRVIPEN